MSKKLEKSIEITFQCPICGKKHYLTLTLEQAIHIYREYNNDAKIQDVVPELSASDREKFITGMCDECQELIFK